MGSIFTLTYPHSCRPLSTMQETRHLAARPLAPNLETHLLDVSRMLVCAGWSIGVLGAGKDGFSDGLPPLLAVRRCCVCDAALGVFQGRAAVPEVNSMNFVGREKAMRASSSSHERDSGAEPGTNAWPPARQNPGFVERCRDSRTRIDLPPRPEAPPATAPTPGMSASLAPPNPQASKVPGPAPHIGTDRYVATAVDPIASSREAA